MEIVDFLSTPFTDYKWAEVAFLYSNFPAYSSISPLNLGIESSRKYFIMQIFAKLCVFGIIAVLGVLAQDEEICPPGADTWPHHNCSQFYACNNGNPIVATCPENLYWNPEAEYCDFPDNVEECVDGTRPPTGTTLPVTQSTPAPTQQSTTTSAPITTVPTTPPPSTPGPSSTAEETPETEAPLTTTTPHTTTEEQPETEDTAGTPSTTTRLPPGVCPETGIIKIAHPEFCESYYLCVNGVRQEPPATCPDGLLFDPSLAECNQAADVDCGSASPRTTTTTTEAPTYQCPDQGAAVIPYQGNCTLYIMCIDGSQTVYRCPPGYLFDTGKLVCEHESTAECTVGFSLAGFFEHLGGVQVEVGGEKDIVVIQESSFSKVFGKLWNFWK
ncbi:chondroitin proteoglycan 1 [Folsomia candida]|uniref:Putative chitinase 3 n=1 Tax=Folsomia candida TaxID=158441 RepID=A0A226DU35_FOLCA|nr:chondroitin proteoglycan 1 [Folsomia candida]OXA47726.1 putative chitinase 3 [Folsomia candida]